MIQIWLATANVALVAEVENVNLITLAAAVLLFVSVSASSIIEAVKAIYGSLSKSHIH